MGLFNKKKKQKNSRGKDIPKLPELPELPNFEDNKKTTESPHQLPSFPSNSFGDKFSQNTIKDAVSGRDEDDEENLEIKNPILGNKKKIMTEEVSDNPVKETPKRNAPSQKNKKRTDPVFIRVDKFEESLDIFSDAKEKVSSIEKELKEIKETKEEEEKELKDWEEKIKSVKNQIDKVDREVFSEIE